MLAGRCRPLENLDHRLSLDSSWTSAINSSCSFRDSRNLFRIAVVALLSRLADWRGDDRPVRAASWIPALIVEILLAQPRDHWTVQRVGHEGQGLRGFSCALFEDAPDAVEVRRALVVSARDWRGQFELIELDFVRQPPSTPMMMPFCDLKSWIACTVVNVLRSSRMRCSSEALARCVARTSPAADLDIGSAKAFAIWLLVRSSEVEEVARNSSATAMTCRFSVEGIGHRLTLAGGGRRRNPCRFREARTDAT